MSIIRTELFTKINIHFKFSNLIFLFVFLFIQNIFRYGPILEKDPGFNFEDFAKIYWSPEGYQWTDEGFSRGRLGSYNEMTGDIELGLAPFGK